MTLGAVFAPVIASGRPLVFREFDGAGSVVRTSSPLLDGLTPVDLVVLAAAGIGGILFAAPARTGRWARAGILLAACAQAGATLAIIGATIDAAAPERWLPSTSVGGPRLSYVGVVTAAVAVCFLAVPITRGGATRLALVVITAVIAGAACGYARAAPLREPRYHEEVAAGRAGGVYTLIPYSPEQGSTERSLLPPGSPAAASAVPAVRGVISRAAPPDGPADVPVTPRLLNDIETAVRGSGIDAREREAIVTDLRERWATGRLPDGRAVVAAIRSRPGPRFLLGTDAFGRDVLSQMLHACRLSISIGLVSTGIAVVIGVTLGAIMGYFGGWVDLVLSRVVEAFMSVPLLFLLIVAAGVLPHELRGTHTLMAIIGCFTWTGAARFTRAEFLKLRGQDFVHSARALGLPLRSILFRHMLPNGVTPVLVEASFGVAAAITIEATLSYLGLGPVDQASWGRLLSGAYDQGGTFQWWLAAFPGGAILLTVLSLNLIGEALRDAMDPKVWAAAGVGGARP